MNKSNERKISSSEIGEVFFRIYESEINFRFENIWDMGFTWSVVGYEGEPEPGEIRWSRIEIDDGMEKGWNFTDPNVQRDLESIHFMKKDWLERGNNQQLEVAVEELCEAICRQYPESNFAKWFFIKAETKVAE